MARLARVYVDLGDWTSMAALQRYLEVSQDKKAEATPNFEEVAAELLKQRKERLLKRLLVANLSRRSSWLRRLPAISCRLSRLCSNPSAG
jgi:hypothetical protein